MYNPTLLNERELRELAACMDCEPDRRPRMFVCDYHEGWLEGYEAALRDVKRLA